MASSRAGAGDTRDEPRILGNARHSESARHTPPHTPSKVRHIKGTQEPSEELLIVGWNDLNHGNKVASDYNAVCKRNTDESILI